MTASWLQAEAAAAAAPALRIRGDCGPSRSHAMPRVRQHTGAAAAIARNMLLAAAVIAAAVGRTVQSQPEAPAATAERSRLGLACLGAGVAPRRQAALSAALGGLVVGGASPCGTAHAQRPPVKLRQVVAEAGLDEYRLDEYEAMRDDEPRTSKYEAAIRRRLAGTNGQAVVCDIGTGPFALLALIAARAGARRVYAIEKSPGAAKLAREAVKEAGFEGVVQVIEGESTQVKLPERVDFVVSELIGSIAKQEGVQRIIADASERFLKKAGPGSGRVCPGMIPARCQTFIAPVAYRYHSLMRVRPDQLKPLRLDSESRDILFLAEPQLLEDFDYCRPVASGSRESRKFNFQVLADGGNTVGSFSGFAMWCRVEMDDVDVIEVRGQRSHWTYVVALMSPLPVAVAAPSQIRLTSRIDFKADPVQYDFEAELIPA